MSGPRYTVRPARPPESDFNPANPVPLQHEASAVVQEIRAVSISFLGKLEILFKDQAWKTLLAQAEKLGQPCRSANLSEETNVLQKALALIDSLLEQEGALRGRQPTIRFGMLYACDSAVLAWAKVVGKLREIGNQEDYRNLQSVLDDMLPQPGIVGLDWETQGFHVREAARRFCRLVVVCNAGHYLMSSREPVARNMPPVYSP